MKTYTPEELRSLLAKNILKFSFTKADGSKRDTVATLMPEHLPAYEETPEQAAKSAAFKASNPDVVTYWDLEAKAFRRVKIETLDHESVTSCGGV